MTEVAGLEDVLLQLERAISGLADGGAPLEQLVADYERAQKLLGEAEGLLEAARARIGEPT